MRKRTLVMKAKGIMGKITGDIKKKNIQWKKTLSIFTLTIILGLTSFFVYQEGFAYEVKLNGKDLGFVKDIHTVEEVLNIVEKDIAEEFGQDAYFHKKIETEKVRGHNKDVVDSSKLGDMILNNIEVFKPAYIISIDGEDEIVVDSKENAETILEEIKKPYIREKENENIELVKIDFKQEVEILSKDVNVESILSKQEALQALGIENHNSKDYILAEDNSSQKVSRSFGIGNNRLEKAKILKNKEEVELENKENLIISKPILEVIAIERHKSTLELDFEIEEKEDSSIYKGEKKIKQEGTKGKKEVITEKTFVNGVQTKSDVIKETTIEKPKNKIVLIGTKERQRIIKKSVSRGASNSRVAPTYNGNLGSSIVATARHYLGIPYKYGGSTPSGFDCSGFTSYVYKQYGISLPRSSSGQGSFGAYIDKSQLRPGDIVVFPRHVGIYVGGNSFIHSPSPGKSVEIASLNSSYYKNRFICGRRPY